METKQAQQDFSLEEYISQTAKNFIDKETAGGLVLIGCTIVALGLANSPLAERFHHFWETSIGLTVGNLSFTNPLHFYINDALMVVFFFVVGLEIRRELYAGNLSSWKNASLPMMAALGGMVFPALIYTIFNAGAESAHGWGVPMATDIAYSLGIISLLGKKIPVTLKVFLTALAVVDDIGAVIVIALFYSSEISWTYLGIGAGIIGLLFLLNYLKLTLAFPYLLIGVGLWFAFLKSGIHPTLAGVLLAFTIPVQIKMTDEAFREESQQLLERFNEVSEPERSVLENKEQLKEIEKLRSTTKKFRPLALRLERRLSGVNSFFVMPLFALANAGVTFEAGWVEHLLKPVGLGIMLGLVIGKLLGVTIFSFITVKTKLGKLPEGANFQSIIGIGLIAGIGFTMSLFIANLAFQQNVMLVNAKTAVLCASLMAALAGLGYLSLIYRKQA